MGCGDRGEKVVRDSIKVFGFMNEDGVFGEGIGEEGVYLLLWNSMKFNKFL